ncbi:MAG: molybdopterin-binding protein [Rhizobiaceae bacterium]
MKFGEVPVQEAKGGLVAHAIVLPDRRLKKGHVLSQDDLQQLVDAGVEQLTIAQLEVGDVEENAAATQLSAQLTSNGIVAADAFTGRVNLYAKATGIFHADSGIVDRFNRISPAITLASLNDGVFVEAGRMVATVKIIPFAVEQEFVAQAEQIISGNDVLSVAQSRSLQVGLVATQLPSLKPATMDKTARILADRLKPSRSTVIAERRVDHHAGAVASALGELQDQCDMLIVFGASAITDRQDVIPSGIEQAGGTVDHFGMPVDPGNLLLLGKLNGKVVIGAPGCARSPAENGFDWVLQRAICDLPIDEAYITGLGVGGLLMEINARPQPREG